MTFMASQLIEKFTAHAQSDSLEDAREICADGTYFPNNLRTYSDCLVNLLKIKRNLLCIRNQSVPRCKHFPLRL